MDSVGKAGLKRTLMVGSILISACALLVGTASGQDAPPLPIKNVSIKGLARTNPTYATDIIGVSTGDKLDRAVLDQAVRRLLRTGKFLTARYDVVEEADGAVVVFEVRERALISAVIFEGNLKFRDKQLAEEVAVKAGDSVDPFSARAGRDGIRQLYLESGYSEVVVSFDQDRLESTGQLAYRIEEGIRVRVRRIEFQGNEAFKSAVLQRQIATKKAAWILNPGDFDPERAESDAAALQRYYRDAGFLDARASYQREVSDDGRDLTLIFTIVEGTQYRISEIDFRTGDVFSREELIDVMSSIEGDVIRQPIVDQDVRAMQAKFWELGYIYSGVRATRVFAEEPGLVSLIIEAQAGEQFRIGKVVARGNARTRDKVVRRALQLYPPDDLLDLNETKEAETRLRQTQIFDSARVFPIGDEPGRRDVVIDVQEAERSGDVVFGLGVTSNSGVVGTIVLDLKNFDISDWPRSWSELFKFRSLFGGGQRFRLEFQPGTEVSRFRIDFTEPYLYDKPLRFDASLFLFSRGRDGYDENRIGFTTSLGKRFERGILAGWSGEAALRFENVGVDNVDLFASSEIRDDEGSNFLTSLKLSLVRDRTDNRFIPSKGDRVRFSYEQFGILGGDLGFARLSSVYTWYKTLNVDNLDRKSVLRLKGEGGAIIGDAPVFERFFAGGIGSIRGFEFRGVGEHDGLNNNNIGGNYLILLGAEYSFPLIGENVRGHVFLDTGTAGSGSYRGAIGAGVRITLDIFGPLPLEFNLAAPFGNDGNDDEQVFSFLIGTLF